MGIAIALAGLGVGALWWSLNGPITTDEQALFSKLNAATTNNHPRTRDVIAAFDLPRVCGEPYTLDDQRGNYTKTACRLESLRIAGLKGSYGGLSDTKDGLHFHTGSLEGSCVRTKRVQEYFKTDSPEIACTEGGCWAIPARYSWGSIFFTIRKPQSRCIQSVTISTRWQDRKRLLD